MPLQRSLHKNPQLTKQTQQPLSKNSPRQLFNIMYILNQNITFAKNPINNQTLATMFYKKKQFHPWMSASLPGTHSYSPRFHQVTKLLDQHFSFFVHFSTVHPDKVNKFRAACRWNNRTRTGRKLRMSGFRVSALNADHSNLRSIFATDTEMGVSKWISALIGAFDLDRKVEAIFAFVYDDTSALGKRAQVRALQRYFDFITEHFSRSKFDAVMEHNFGQGVIFRVRSFDWEVLLFAMEGAHRHLLDYVSIRTSKYSLLVQYWCKPEYFFSVDPSLTLRPFQGVGRYFNSDLAKIITSTSNPQNL